MTFNADGGSPIPAAQDVAEGGKVTEPTGVTKPGYTLDGWYNDSQKWDFANDTVNGDMTLKAKWTKEPPLPTNHKVTFDADGGTPTPTVQDVAEGGKVTEPTGVTKPGHILDGWYNDANKWDFANDTVNGDMTLKAKWTKEPPLPTNHRVTFDADGGSPIPVAQVVAHNGFASRPTDPFKTSYAFKYWSEDGGWTPFDFSQPILRDVHLVARYEYMGAYEPVTPIVPNHWWTYEKPNADRPKEDKPKVDTPTEVQKEVTTISFTVDKREYKVNTVVIPMDGKPYVQSERIMLPMRYVSEALDMDVSYDNQTRIATFKDDTYHITIHVDTGQMMINGKEYKLEVKPEIKDSRIYLPMGLIADALGMTREKPDSGFDISWYQDIQSVVITIIK
ncbi:MAG: InlB B-repeat-containing protein [Tissierellia bacterium]|nr:InlB B-repeat-containing protein [Tissierellia bacterium]